MQSVEKLSGDDSRIALLDRVCDIDIDVDGPRSPPKSALQVEVYGGKIDESYDIIRVSVHQLVLSIELQKTCTTRCQPHGLRCEPPATLRCQEGFRDPVA